MHYAHIQPYHQQVRLREVCQTLRADQDKSGLQTLLLRETCIIGWTRFRGFGHGAPQGRVHFGTFKKAWQHDVLCSLRENRMLQTTWA